MLEFYLEIIKWHHEYPATIILTLLLLSLSRRDDQPAARPTRELRQKVRFFDPAVRVSQLLSAAF